MPHSAVAVLLNRETEDRLCLLERQALLSDSSLCIVTNDAQWQEQSEPFLLLCEAGYLQLRPRNRKLQSLMVDFTEGAMAYRGQQNVRNEMLVKAILGRNKQHLPDVTDATAGLGRDSFLLAVLGCDVTMVERNPVVSALLQDGLYRFQQQGDPEIASRLRLMPGDFANGAGPEQGTEVVYLDPMFPAREKSALVKKEMQIFKQIVGGDTDSAALLEQARQRAAQRVVVKRPAKADYLANVKPTYSVTGRSSRFDVYQVGSLPT